MTQLLNFALVKITEGQYAGRMGRLYDTPFPTQPDAPQVVRIVPDRSLGELNIQPELFKRSRHTRDIYNIFPTRVVEFVDMSQPSDEFMNFHAQQLQKIIVDEMNKSIEAELILERISTLGELYDILAFQKSGWQTIFWNKFTDLLVPKQKKRPKSAMKRC